MVSNKLFFATDNGLQNISISTEPQVDDVIQLDSKRYRITEIKCVSSHVDMGSDYLNYYIVGVKELRKHNNVGAIQVKMINAQRTEDLDMEINKFLMEHKCDYIIRNIQYTAPCIAMIEYAVLNDRKRYELSKMYESYENNGKEVRYFNPHHPDANSYPKPSFEHTIMLPFESIK